MSCVGRDELRVLVFSGAFPAAKQALELMIQLLDKLCDL